MRCHHGRAPPANNAGNDCQTRSAAALRALCYSTCRPQGVSRCYGGAGAGISSVTTVQGSGGWGPSPGSSGMSLTMLHGSSCLGAWLDDGMTEALSGESLASVTAHMTRDSVLPSTALWLARRLGRCLTCLMAAKQGDH